MSLWEFIQKRCELKNIKPFDLVDEGISSASLYRMQDGGTPGERIKNKLSAALGCSIGEINEAISQTDQTTPFGETVKKTKKKESIMATVDKLEKMVSEKPYVTPEPKEEPHLYNVKHPAEEETPVKVPVKVDALEPDEDTDSMVLAVEEYKEQWRNKIIKQLTEADLATTVEEFWREIGKEFAKEVL